MHPSHLVLMGFAVGAMIILGLSENFRSMVTSVSWVSDQAALNFGGFIVSLGVLGFLVWEDFVYPFL